MVPRINMRATKKGSKKKKACGFGIILLLTSIILAVIYSQAGMEAMLEVCGLLGVVIAIALAAGYAISLILND